MDNFEGLLLAESGPSFSLIFGYLNVRYWLKQTFGDHAGITAHLLSGERPLYPWKQTFS